MGGKPPDGKSSPGARIACLRRHVGIFKFRADFPHRSIACHLDVISPRTSSARDIGEKTMARLD
jgi:hypothetical protein